jgi:hypothetical protein
MGLIDLNIGTGGKTSRRAKNARPYDLRIFTRAGAALSGIMAVLVLVLGFLAAFLSEDPGFAMLGAGMICLPIAIALAVFAVVFWKL